MDNSNVNCKFYEHLTHKLDNRHGALQVTCSP